MIKLIYQREILWQTEMKTKQAVWAGDMTLARLPHPDEPNYN